MVIYIEDFYMIRIAVMASSLAMVLLSPASSRADTISPDGGIFQFNFGDVGSSLGNLTFTLTKSAKLVITDLYYSGDQFLITNFGSELGITSTPTPGSNVGDDYFAALADPAFSKATFSLTPGSYDLSGTVLANAPGFTGGTGALTLSTVPLPASAPMFGAALLALGAIGYGVNRKKATAAA